MSAAQLHGALAEVVELSSPKGAPWEFLIIFATLLLGPAIVERARVPGLIGLLLGGYAIGPHGLDLIGPGNTTVPDLGQLGLLYLMFVAGVELDLNLLRRYKRSAVVFGLLTFLLPMAFGTTVGLGLGWQVLAAILLGSLLASHTLITYPAVRDAGLASDPAVATVVGSTVLTDTLTLVVLAAVAGAVGRESLDDRRGRPDRRRSDGSDRLQHARAAAAGGLGVSIVRGRARGALHRGDHSVSGGGDGRRGVWHRGHRGRVLRGPRAESAGAQRRAVDGSHRLLRRRGVHPRVPGVDWADPQPGGDRQRRNAGSCGSVHRCVPWRKVLAAALSARLLGFSRPQAGLLFSLSAAQAAATLAATVVGFQLGLFSSAVVNAVLVLIFASVLVSTLVGTRAIASMAAHEDRTRPMGARVVVGVGDPASAAGALAIAVRIARADGGVVQPVLVVPQSAPFAPRAAHGRLRHAAAVAGVDGVVSTVVDRSLLHGAMHAGVAAEATLVLVAEPAALDAAGLEAAREIVADGLLGSPPVAFVHGSAPRLGVVRTLVASEGGEDSHSLLSELSQRVAGGSADRLHERDGDWATLLAADDVTFVSVGPDTATTIPPDAPGIVVATLDLSAA